MNKGYQHIILVTDGSKTSRSAEETAVNLATQHRAKVIIVDTVRPPSFASQWLTSNSKELFDVIISDKQERLKQVAQKFKDAGIDVDVRILFGKSSEEIARTALADNADLVVRYMKGSKSRHASAFGNTARNLMRICPCPLLLVRDQTINEPRVLACVNAEHEFNENEAILTEAEKLAGPAKKLMALYCWKFHGSEILHEYMDDRTFQRYVNEAEQNYRGIYERFLEKHDLSSFDQSVHLENGDPIQVIPEVCRHESIDVAVMSSASQDHPIRRLLGSTIESVLEELPSALLVVKPLGFKSPIKPSHSTVELGTA
jgi:nucleotide-binding universal stress UspA family protein